MLFNVEQDEGERIIAYVVPDGFSGIPRIRLISEGADVLVCTANETRPALVAAGRHESGLCGFNIGADQLPGLAALHDLAIVDDETGLLIYRRPQEGRLRRKVLRLETHLFPLWKLDSAVRDRVQYFEMGIERYGRESVTQMFLLTGLDSVYLSGRILYKNFAYWIENGFETAVILQDPYEELAERLLLLAAAQSAGAQHLGARDSVRLQPAMNFAGQLPFHDERNLRRALLDMPVDVADLLANPLVRQLTASNPEDMPTGSAIAAALDMLASCTLVGLRSDPAFIRAAMGDWLDVDLSSRHLLPDFPRVPPLAAILRQTRAVDHLLEADGEVFGKFLEVYTGE